MNGRFIVEIEETSDVMCCGDRGVVHVSIKRLLELQFEDKSESKRGFQSSLEVALKKKKSMFIDAPSLSVSCPRTFRNIPSPSPFPQRKIRSTYYSIHTLKAVR